MSRRGNGSRRQASRLGLSVACALALAALIGPAATASAASSHTQTYSTPGVFGFTVPDNVDSITVHVVGAAGGSCSLVGPPDTSAGQGGKGADTTATVAVTPGSSLIVGVGGMGGACTSGPQPGVVTRAIPAATGGGGAGGTNGGAEGGPAPGFLGASGAGGGGASGVLASPTSPLVVSGGGGGGAYCGGNGGNADSAGTSGQVTTPCVTAVVAGHGGAAGTVQGPGNGGAAGNPSTTSAGAPGKAEFGGPGGAGATFVGYSGGGGGGGLYGGGGGGGGGTDNGGGGGGGGASFVLPAATNVSAPAPTTAPAEVTITYTAVPAPKATTHKATAVKQTSCTLHGTVNGEGLATTYSFQWGRSKSYGHATAKHKTGGKSKSVSAVIRHLKSGRTYHFRVVASTASGTAHGKDMTCTTLKPKVKPVFTG